MIATEAAAGLAVAPPAGGHRGASIGGRGLWFSFDEQPVLRNVGLEVAAGTRLGLLGPNGAGKTTLIRLLAGLLRPIEGEVLLGGVPFDTDRQASRRAIGVVGHQSYLYPELTVAENLAFYARLYRVQGASARIDNVLRMVGLQGRRVDRVSTLSRGMTQRAALARAIVHDPSVLLLDEPDTGLDLEGLRVLEEIVHPPGGMGRTVVLSTHNLEHALGLCDRIVVLCDGRIVDDLPSIDLDASGLRDRYGRLIGQATGLERGAR